MEKSSYRAWWSQLLAMLWKNWLFTRRRWKLTIIQLISPLFFVGILLALDALPKNAMENPYNPLPRDLNPAAKRIGEVQRCKSWNGQPCKTLRYAKGIEASAETEQNIPKLMSFILAEAGLEAQDVEMLSSADALIDYVKQNPNTTTNALLFHSINARLYKYTVMFNASSDLLTLLVPSRRPDNRNELQIAVDRAIIRFHGEVYALVDEFPVNITYSTRRFPQLGYKGGKSSVDDNGVVFFYCGLMFQFVVLLYNICQEKDLLLRRGLKTIGLMDSVYWVSWILTAMVLCLISTGVLFASGYGFEIKFFTEVDLSVNLVLFLVFCLATCGLAMFISVFVAKAKSSLNSGILFFVLGLLLVAILSEPNSKDAIFNPYNVTPAVAEILSLIFPMFSLGSAMCEIKNVINTNETRFTWDDIFHQRFINQTLDSDPLNYKYTLVPVPTTADAFLRLLLNFVVFVLLGTYLDQVLPSPNGETRKWYFFADPKFWGIGKTDLVDIPEAKPLVKQASNTSSLEMTDVQEEEVYVKSQMVGNPSGRYGSLLQVRGLVKRFNIKKDGKKTTFNAVDGVFLAAEENEVFVLLGHNGAGKSTMINMLTGLLHPTDGDATIAGFSVKREMDSVRQVISVCVQHDVLWEELTAREHMMLVGILKQMDRHTLSRSINDLLSDVQLSHVADQPVGTFSGGMKRRLSVALSFVGNPRVVFLDEPSTGMDPYVRRDIWNLILRMRKKKAILMTTHSMEEADVLGDKIAVMSGGKLKTLGTSTKLKNHFAGYHLTASLWPENRHDFHAIVNGYLAAEHDVKADKFGLVDGRNVLYVSYSLQPNSDSGIVMFLEELERNKANGKQLVLDINFSQASLEQVFLAATKE